MLEVGACVFFQYVLVYMGNVNNKEKAEYYKKEPTS